MKLFVLIRSLRFLTNEHKGCMTILRMLNLTQNCAEQIKFVKKIGFLSNSLHNTNDCIHLIHTGNCKYYHRQLFPLNTAPQQGIIHSAYENI